MDHTRGRVVTSPSRHTGTRASSGRPGRRTGLLLVALGIGALGVLPVRAQSREDLSAAARRLRQVEASLERLPDTGITRDAGEIAVIEHDGSSYDARRPDGTLNYEARLQVGRRFYEAHADEFDFLVVFTNFPFETRDATAFHLYGRNDVDGIGKPVGSVSPAPFGSPSRLKGWIDMADVGQYRERPFSLEPGDPGFQQTLGVLAHEMGHQWLAEARYRKDGVVFDDLLGADEMHWSYLLDSDGSFLYGADWRDNEDGTFTAAAVRERFSSLDLYLMGLLPPEKLAPLTLLRNPEVDRHRINAEGDVVTAGGTTTILGEDVVAAMGPRRPDHAHSQKEFRLGFVFLTRPGTEPSLDDLEAVERVRRAFGAHFFALTNGAGWADTSLGTPARGTPAPAPDLARALAWLAARQGLDGSWEDSPQTRVRDTASAVAALLRARTGLPAAQRGTAWLSVARPESLDFQARAVLAVDASRLAPVERAARLSGILAAQNPDGGFGAGRDFSSDPLDTALAMRALRSLGQAPDARVERAVQALAALANPDGGWPAVVGGETSTVATAEALLALLDWSDVPGSAALRGNGLTALVSRQNPDGGFGSSPSTPYASALALDVLLRSGGAAPLVEPLTAWLQAAQLADGSWGSSAWQTALVVAALGQALGSNLVVPGDSLVVAPSPAREGDVVRVTARVRNSGRAPAPATVARLFDGDPASTPALGEAPVSPLTPGEEAEVAFDYATVDRPGTRTLHVVADAASQAAEAREDDNTTSRPLTVEGILADLVVGPEDVQVSPAGPEVGETVSVIVAVRNAGQRASSPAAVAVRISGPSGGRVDLPPVTLPALPPAGAASVSVPWRPAGEGAHVVRVAADALYQLPEADETNNAADRPVTVVAQAPEDPELAVVGATVMPAALEEVPQPIEVRAVVENSGRAAATTAVTVIDSQTGGWLGTADVELPARATRHVVLHGSLSTAGARSLSVVVDPDAGIAEGDEANNTYWISLLDARTYDLELVAGALSETDVELGQTITATAEVRNRGTVDVLGIPVQLAHDAAGGPAELARTTISLNAGDSGTVVLRWPTSLTGGALPLSLRVDPFDLLPERREDNNAASLALIVRPSGRPNLAMTGAEVTLAPDPLVEGQGATLSAVVRNTGAAAAPSFRVRFVVGDPDAGGVVVGETAVDGLAAGADVVAALAWPRVDLRGSLGLYVIADAGGEVEESREDDNRAFRPFAAIGLPDLVLAAADVVLDPGYPRAGEAVTVRATVRNLGGRSSGAATELAVTEGEPGAGVEVGRLPVPVLEPGSLVSLSIPWSPGAPPGPRPLSLVLDPGGLVEEQDEGNNEVRRTVVAQDADFFLTEPVFSPDGDGVKDETTLAWRATGRVTVVVSNARGEAVRTLVEDGPETGSVTWDGRTARGTVAWDGSYTASVTGDGGASLGSASLVLDTNRSPIHDASPRQTTVRNLTCALPQVVRGPAWTAGEDEALYIVPVVQPGFPVGLLRASTDGAYSYVAQDVWYGSADFPS
ncbi:MAG TPA: CARDB domain-containing protein, partial [Vicinamibacteria bacterium]